MKKKSILPIPVIAALKKLGNDINYARRRRRIPMSLMAERAGITPITLGKVEKGSPATSMAAYASVLYVLGLSDKLKDIADASNDLTGRMLEDEALPRRVRIKKHKEQVES